MGNCANCESLKQNIERLQVEVERLKAAPKWKTCDTHGQGDAFTWGCPECVREMRALLAAIKRLPDEWEKFSSAQVCIRQLRRVFEKHGGEDGTNR